MAGLSAPARRALEGAGILDIRALAARSESELLRLHGLGPGSLPIIRAAIRTASNGPEFNKKKSTMRNTTKKPTNTDTYLDQLPADQQAALRKVRQHVIAAAPTAVEHFGYGLPGFKYNGHPLIYFGAAKEHCALYGAVPSGFTEQLADFEVSKGTIRFTPKRPLTAALVKAIVKARMMENDARWPAKKKPTPTKTTTKK